MTYYVSCELPEEKHNQIKYTTVGKRVNTVKG